MQHLTFPLFFLLLSLSAYAQNNLNAVQYLDKHHRPVEPGDGAVYYRTIEKAEDGFVLKDYYVVNDSLQRAVFCSRIEPHLVYDGKATWYYKNGTIKETGRYTNGKQTGLFKYYYEDGSPQKEILYKPPTGLLLCQYWTEDGRPLLVNGTGVINREDTDLPYGKYREVEDSLIVTSYYIRPDAGDTIFLETKERAEYIGGIEQLYSDLGKNFKGKYPAEARQHGIQGRVFIEFIIDKKGIAREERILRGIGYGCDEAALRVFNKLGKWKPSYYHGKPVKTKMVLPVMFSLD